MEGRRRQTNIMIARSDAVSFWVGKLVCFATVEHGMVGKCLEEQYLQLGATSAEAICSGKASAILCPRAVYVLRTFFKLWLPRDRWAL